MLGSKLPHVTPNNESLTPSTETKIFDTIWRHSRPEYVKTKFHTPVKIIMMTIYVLVTNVAMALIMSLMSTQILANMAQMQYNPWWYNSTAIL